MNGPYWIENPEDNGRTNGRCKKRWGPEGKDGGVKEPTMPRIQVTPGSSSTDKDGGKGEK